jgi:hypothetical protein
MGALNERISLGRHQGQKYLAAGEHSSLRGGLSFSLIALQVYAQQTLPEIEVVSPTPLPAPSP